MAIGTANRSPDKEQLRFTIATLSHFETDLKVLLGANTARKPEILKHLTDNKQWKNLPSSPIQTILLI